MKNNTIRFMLLLFVMFLVSTLGDSPQNVESQNIDIAQEVLSQPLGSEIMLYFDIDQGASKNLQLTNVELWQQLNEEAEQREASLAQQGIESHCYVLSPVCTTLLTESLATASTNVEGLVAIDVVRSIPLADTVGETTIIPQGVSSVNWGISASNVELAWEFSRGSSNVVIGTIDTGAHRVHPELIDTFWGDGGWVDFISSGPTPYDYNGHGTHVLGIAGGKTTGVAPTTPWITAKACEPAPIGCPYTALFDAADWMGEFTIWNPTTRLVVNNSWAASQAIAYYGWFDQAINNWKALGIIPVFAAGNDGPACQTAGVPASTLMEVLNAAAYTESGSIAYYSSRGTAFSGIPFPFITAPGDNVISAIPPDLYGSKSGTSMAAPHLTGTVALMLSVNPTLSFSQIRDILRSTASSKQDGTCGYNTYGDNTYGSGILDTGRAVFEAAPKGNITGRVINAVTGYDIANAKVVFSKEVYSETRFTDYLGYSMYIPKATYSVTVSAWGYETLSTSYSVSGDSNVDFSLTPLPVYKISGTLFAGSAPTFGFVKIDTPASVSAVTDLNGNYEISLIEGSYTLIAETPNCRLEKLVSVPPAQTTNFTFAASCMFNVVSQTFVPLFRGNQNN